MDIAKFELHLKYILKVYASCKTMQQLIGVWRMLDTLQVNWDHGKSRAEHWDAFWTLDEARRQVSRSFLNKIGC